MYTPQKMYNLVKFMENITAFAFNGNKYFLLHKIVYSLNISNIYFFVRSKLLSESSTSKHSLAIISTLHLINKVNAYFFLMKKHLKTNIVQIYYYYKAYILYYTVSNYYSKEIKVFINFPIIFHKIYSCSE